MVHARVTWPWIEHIIGSRTTYQSRPNRIEKIGFFLFTLLWKMRSVSHIDKINWILGCQMLCTCIPSQCDPLFWSFAWLYPPLIGCGFPPSLFFALLVRRCLHSEELLVIAPLGLEFVRCGDGGNGRGQFAPCVRVLLNTRAVCLLRGVVLLSLGPWDTASWLVSVYTAAPLKCFWTHVWEAIKARQTTGLGKWLSHVAVFIRDFSADQRLDCSLLLHCLPHSFLYSTL